MLEAVSRLAPDALCVMTYWYIWLPRAQREKKKKKKKKKRKKGAGVCTLCVLLLTLWAPRFAGIDLAAVEKADKCGGQRCQTV